MALRMLRPTLSAVLNGRAELFSEMALRFEKAFSLSMDTLIRMQCAYDTASGWVSRGRIMSLRGT